MENRNDVEDHWSVLMDDASSLTRVLLRQLDRIAEFDFITVAHAFFREGYESARLDHFLVGRLAKEAQEQIQCSVPEAGPEEVERPLDGGAGQEGVAGPAPLGEAPLDEGPEVEGVDGDPKEYRWGGGLLLRKDGAVFDGRFGPPQFIVNAPLTGTEIFRLANRVKELDEALRAVRPALAYGQRAPRWEPIWGEALRRIDQALSSGRLHQEPGDLADIAAVDGEDGEGGSGDAG